MQGQAKQALEKVQAVLRGQYDKAIQAKIKEENLSIGVDEFRYKWAAAQDPYYLVKKILKYDKLRLDTHWQMCQEMRYDRKKYKRILRLRPRRIYKTTIYNISGCIDMLLEDFDANILILMNTATNAWNKLSEIKTQFEQNLRFRSLYGDWAKDAPRWQKESIIINKSHKRKAEGSIDAAGIDTGLTSRHYSWLKLDDLVDERDRDSAAKRRDTRNAFEDAFDLVQDHNCGIEVTGTPWHFDDLYHYIIEDLNPKLEKEGLESFKVVWEGVYLNDGETLRHPNFFDEQVLKQLMVEKGIVSFTAQYILKCLPDDTQIFIKGNAHYFQMKHLDLADCDVYGYHDPALGESEKACYAPIVTGAIPNYSSEEGGFEKGDILIIAMNVERYTPTQGRNIMARLHGKYHYGIMGVESNGFQKLYADSAVKVELEKDKWTYVPIEPINNTQSKTSRIESFERYYTPGAVKFRSDYRDAPDNYAEGLSQLWNYPLDDYRDVPDALAGLIQTINESNPSIA